MSKKKTTRHANLYTFRPREITMILRLELNLTENEKADLIEAFKQQFGDREKTMIVEKYIPTGSIWIIIGEEVISTYRTIVRMINKLATIEFREYRHGMIERDFIHTSKEELTRVVYGSPGEDLLGLTLADLIWQQAGFSLN